MTKDLLKTFIKLYKRILSPALPPACRFYPTCSEYAYGAVETHGPAKGALLAVKRLFRCHPLNPGGYDPVPQAGRCGGSTKGWKIIRGY